MRCHKVIHKHYLCFNVIWSNACIRIPDNHTAPSAWIAHMSIKNNCISPLMRIKRLQPISLTHAIWRTWKRVWAYAPRLDTEPTKEYLIKSGGGLSGHEEFWQRGFIVLRRVSTSRCRNDQRRLHLAECWCRWLFSGMSKGWISSRKKKTASSGDGSDLNLWRWNCLLCSCDKNELKTGPGLIHP